MSMIVSARPGPARLVERVAVALVGAQHEDVAAGEEAAAARQRLLGLVGDALLELGADHEQDEREQQPARRPPSRPT